MPDISDLLFAIVKPLIDHPDIAHVTTKPAGDFIEYHLSLDPGDVGRVIGKQGRVANAIRSILYSVKTPGPRAKRVRLFIEGTQ